MVNSYKLYCGRLFKLCHLFLRWHILRSPGTGIAGCGPASATEGPGQGTSTSGHEGELRRCRVPMTTVQNSEEDGPLCAPGLRHEQRSVNLGAFSFGSHHLLITQTQEQIPITARLFYVYRWSAEKLMKEVINSGYVIN